MVSVPMYNKAPISILFHILPLAERVINTVGAKKDVMGRKHKQFSSKKTDFTKCILDVPSMRTHLYLDNNIKTLSPQFLKLFKNNFNKIKNVYHILVFQNMIQN